MTAPAAAIPDQTPPSVGASRFRGRRLPHWRLAGLFVVSLATLMHEILLTRIFSVTLWHHFAFMAISVAMFGTALGAILVYILPRLFPPERTSERLAASAWRRAPGSSRSARWSDLSPFSVFRPSSTVSRPSPTFRSSTS